MLGGEEALNPAPIQRAPDASAWRARSPDGTSWSRVSETEARSSPIPRKSASAVSLLLLSSSLSEMLVPGTPASPRKCRDEELGPSASEYWKGVPSAFILENPGGLVPTGMAMDSRQISR